MSSGRTRAIRPAHLGALLLGALLLALLAFEPILAGPPKGGKGPKPKPGRNSVTTATAGRPSKKWPRFLWRRRAAEAPIVTKTAQPMRGVAPQPAPQARPRPRWKRILGIGRGNRLQVPVNAIPRAGGASRGQPAAPPGTAKYRAGKEAVFQRIPEGLARKQPAPRRIERWDAWADRGARVTNASGQVVKRTTEFTGYRPYVINLTTGAAAPQGLSRAWNRYLDRVQKGLQAGPSNANLTREQRMQVRRQEVARQNAKLRSLYRKVLERQGT